MKSKILNVLAILFGLFLINGGVNKFTNHMPMPADMAEKMLLALKAMESLQWLLPLAGIAEIVGGALLILKKTRPLGIVILAPIMAGILCTHLVQDRSGLPMVAILLAIFIWMIIDNLPNFTPLLKGESSSK
jgi:putative oxidoreductase